jgi:hypothetical protein
MSAGEDLEANEVEAHELCGRQRRDRRALKGEIVALSRPAADRCITPRPLGALAERDADMVGHLGANRSATPQSSEQCRQVVRATPVAGRQ